MTRIAIFWDASQLWGLLVWQAAEALRLPYRLFKAQEIAQGTLSDKISLLIVPGGTARLKAAALGEAGLRAIRDWVSHGGHYLGFCGGAGLGLSPRGAVTAGVGKRIGLGLCPWHREEINEWIQHVISGHVRVSLSPGHPLVPEYLTGKNITVPIWWPGRFAVPKGTPADQDGGVSVLAHYAEGDVQNCQPDLCIADLPLNSLSCEVLEQWQELHGVSLFPEFLRQHPCVVHGSFGKGSYTLSYSHLETPGSPDANRWFAHLVRQLSGSIPCGDTVPDWTPGDTPVRWPDQVLLETRSCVWNLICLGLEHGLLFRRTPWLVGWRARVPGMCMNTLFTTLCVLLGAEPSEAGESFWRARRDRFAEDFHLFRQGVESLLLGQRLATIVPEAVPQSVLNGQRLALFGSAMHYGGLYKALLDVADTLLFYNLGAKRPFEQE